MACERLIARRRARHLLRLVEEAARGHPHLRCRGAGADRVDQDAAAGVRVGEELRERQLRGLGDGVLGHVAGRALAGGRRDVHDASPAAIGHGRESRLASGASGAITFRSQAACQSTSGTSSSFRHFAWPALLTRTSSFPKRSAGLARIRSAASGSVTSRASGGGLAAWHALPQRRPRQFFLAARYQQNRRALTAEPLRDVPPDAAAGAGDDACLAVEPEVHGKRLDRVRDVTVVSPASALWTGHLPAIDAGASRSGRHRDRRARRSVTSNRVGTGPS